MNGLVNSLMNYTLFSLSTEYYYNSYFILSQYYSVTPLIYVLFFCKNSISPIVPDYYNTA